MSEQAQQELKVTDQGAEKIVQKTPEVVKDGAVIAAQQNQEIHDKAFEQSHKNDKTLSEPDMIAMNDGETVAEYKARVAQIQANRFGFFDSEAEEKSKTKVLEHPAKQAVEALPGLSPTIAQPPYDSRVKANVQITNVPEVTEAVTSEVLTKYAETVLENAAAAVHQIENHLAQPNAINSDFQKIGQRLSEGPGHFAQSPDQLNRDISAVASGAMDEIDKPLTPDERAKMAGMLLPMFFFEGGKEPINPETIEQMGLEGLNEAELKALGIEKRIEEVSAVEAENLSAGKIPKDVRSGAKPPEVTREALENPEGLAKLAKKFGINMPPKDTYVFVGEKDAVSAETAAKRLGITSEQLKNLDDNVLALQKLERVPDYRDAFFNAHPGLIPIADRLVIHHGVPKWILKEYPGLFTAAEINRPEYLRGIYRGVNDELHNGIMHKAWIRFKFDVGKPTKADVLHMLESLDEKHGYLFAPEEGI